jgi:hypothetical protein
MMLPSTGTSTASLADCHRKGQVGGLVGILVQGQFFLAAVAEGQAPAQ